MEGHMMAQVKKDDLREHRIDMEVVVDAYNEQERAMGWYYYLQDKLAFPFQGKCIVEKRSSLCNVEKSLRSSAWPQKKTVSMTCLWMCNGRGDP
jgi:hypothetical protein